MVARPRLADPGELIKAAKQRTGEYRVCTDPDLLDEYQRLTLARDAAKEAARDSLAGGRAVDIEAQLAEMLEAVEAATVVLTFKSMPRPRFRALVVEHPARKDADGKLTHPLDVLGVNFDSFFDVLVRTSLLSPVLDAETLTVLLEEMLTDQQYLELTDVVWNLNKTTVNIPFSPAVSPKTRTSSPK